MIVELGDRQRAKQFKEQTAKELGIDIEKLQALIAKASHAGRYEMNATEDIHGIFKSAYLLAFGDVNKQEEAEHFYKSVLSFLENMTIIHNIDIEEVSTKAENWLSWSVHPQDFRKRMRRAHREQKKRSQGNGKV
jgi:hypothetical protein